MIEAPVSTALGTVIDGAAVPLLVMLISALVSWMSWVSMTLVRALGRLVGIDEKMGNMATIGSTLTTHELADAHSFGRIDQRIEGVERRLDDFMRRCEGQPHQQQIQ